MQINERRKSLSTLGAGALALAARPGLVFAQEKSITVTSLGGRWEPRVNAGIEAERAPSDSSGAGRIGTRPHPRI
jgi:hypothetical protein